MRAPSRKSGAKRQEIYAMIHEGIARSVIAERTGYSVATIERMMAGIVVPQRKTTTHQELATLTYQLCRTDRSLRELAKSMGLNLTTVVEFSRLLREAGMEVPKRKVGRPRTRG